MEEQKMELEAILEMVKNVRVWGKSDEHMREIAIHALEIAKNALESIHLEP